MLLKLANIVLSLINSSPCYVKAINNRSIYGYLSPFYCQNFSRCEGKWSLYEFACYLFAPNAFIHNMHRINEDITFIADHISNLWNTSAVAYKCRFKIVSCSRMEQPFKILSRADCGERTFSKIKEPYLQIEK